MATPLGVSQGRIEVNTGPAKASLRDLDRTMQQTAERSYAGFQSVVRTAKIMGAAITAVGTTAAKEEAAVVIQKPPRQ